MLCRISQHISHFPLFPNISHHLPIFPRWEAYWSFEVGNRERWTALSMFTFCSQLLYLAVLFIIDVKGFWLAVKRISQSESFNVNLSSLPKSTRVFPSLPPSSMGFLKFSCRYKQVVIVNRARFLARDPLKSSWWQNLKFYGYT